MVKHYHTIEPLHVSSSAETCDLASHPTWVDNLERDENEEPVTLDHLDNTFDLLGKFYSESSELN